MTRRIRLVAVTALVAVVAGPTVAEAGFVGDVRRGLYLVGFEVFDESNVLTGGREFLATNTFNGNPIEYGPWALTLQGPLSTGFSYANRPYQSFEFSFGTSASGSAATSPLTYSLDFNLGEQSATLSGSLLMDGGASIDRLGFYTLNLSASSRTTLSNSGGGMNSNEYDWDLGPVDIAGNVYIEVLALLTAPLFEHAGVESPFASLTARNQLQAIVDAQTTELLEMLQNGITPGDTTAQRGFSLTLADQAVPGPGLPSVNAAGIVVPEPTVLLLLLAGIPFLARRAGLGWHGQAGRPVAR